MKDSVDELQEEKVDTQAHTLLSSMLFMNVCSEKALVCRAANRFYIGDSEGSDSRRTPMLIDLNE